MAKLLIMVACTLAGAEVSSHADVGDEVEVVKDDASLLTRMGRALYLDKAEDHTKGLLTATAEDKARVKRMVKAIADERVQRDALAKAQSPAGQAEVIASAGAAAVANAMATAAATQAAAIQAAAGNQAKAGA